MTVNALPLGPNEGPNANELPGSKGLVLGWGVKTEVAQDTPNLLHSVEIPIMTLQACKATIPKWEPGTVDSRTLCAGYPQGGKDACRFDSGGPMVTAKVYIYIYAYTAPVKVFWSVCNI